MMNGIGFSGGLFGYDDYKRQQALSGPFGAGQTEDGSRVTGAEDPDKVKKPGHRSSPEDCETCKNRKYQDGSDEEVSFKSAAHISPEASASRVRGHEQEHVVNAYSKAAEKGGKVIHAGVTIHTAICPECGRSYVSGGVTDTVIKYPRDGGKKDQEENGSVTAAGGADGAGAAGVSAGTPGRNGEKENFSV